MTYDYFKCEGCKQIKHKDQENFLEYAVYKAKFNPKRFVYVIRDAILCDGCLAKTKIVEVKRADDTDSE